MEKLLFCLISGLILISGCHTHTEVQHEPLPQEQPVAETHTPKPTPREEVIKVKTTERVVDEYTEVEGQSSRNRSRSSSGYQERPIEENSNERVVDEYIEVE